VSYPRNDLVGCAALPRARGSAVVVFTVYGNKVCCAYRLQILRATFSTTPERRTASSDRGSGPARGFGESSNTHLQLTRGSTRKKKGLFCCPVGNVRARSNGVQIRKSGKVPTGPSLMVVAAALAAVLSRARDRCAGEWARWRALLLLCAHALCYQWSVSHAVRRRSRDTTRPTGHFLDFSQSIIQPPDEPQIYIKSGPRASRIRSNSVDDEDGEDDDDS